MADAQEVQEYAADVLSEWLNGYTCPEDGPQHRIRLVAFQDGVAIVSAKSVPPDDQGEKRFRVEVSVTEVAQ